MRPVQDNVALIAVLEALEAPQAEGGGGSSGSRRPLICIANTHIHANPELNDVKLWQVR
jgi:CCR4-NOT transcription complex subunit 6